MKQVKMSELIEGDVFTERVQLHNRKAFEVTETPKAESKTIKVRETGDEFSKAINKSKKGYVTLLRNINGNVQSQTL